VFHPLRDRRIEVKDDAQLQLMRAAGVVVGETLALLTAAVRPGITTAELDAMAEDHIRSSGAVPSFKGYADPPYPASICVSVNEQVVHGIPGDRVLATGDVVSIDCGAIVDGWHGDAATTVGVGAVSPSAHRLMRVTEDALWAGLGAVRPGGRLSDVSHAVESSVRAAGTFGIVEEYVGHGIGSAMHMPPNVPNVGRPGRGPRLVPGMAIAVEPMVVLGSPATELLGDEWTVVTRDGTLAAHFEHTVAVTPTGPWVLTSLDRQVE
jgi:methionyl aminopeptidase